MAFKRTNFKSLIRNGAERFSTAYKFSKKVPFKVGSDAYIILLGLESGFYETPCHRIAAHKAPNGTYVGFNGSNFATYIKCHGIDCEGNRSESLCCTLAQMEKDRIPDKNDSAKRIVSFTNYRVHLPVLILGNSLGDASKTNYPINKVSILNELRSESGLKFAYIEMSSDTFKNSILKAYGKRLKEDGILDYELDEDSEEFLAEVCQRLSKTVIKVHGVSKQGFDAALKEYSFFPFDNPAIANGSPQGEREAIIGYKDNQEIQNKICEFLDLFNAEVDNMFSDWKEKDLQDYYNSAIMAATGALPATETPEVQEEPVEEEKVEVIETPKAAPKTNPKPAVKAPVVEEEEPKKPQASEDELAQILDNPTGDVEEELEEFEFDSDDEESFFDDEN